MKTPAQYVAGALPADYEEHPNGYLLTVAQAEAAVAAALADSEKYHRLLQRAVRHATILPPQPAAEATPQHD